MNTQPKAVIFDLDGTLIDSVGAIAAVGNAMLAELGLSEMTVQEARQYIGRGAPNFVKQALGARGLEMSGAHLGRFQEIYAAKDGSGNPAFEGVEKTLDRLAAEGVAIGLCTNKPEAPTLAVLDHLGWRARFGSVVAGDTLSVRKPDPAPLRHCANALGVPLPELLYVGDSEVDAATAQAADVKFALFTEGYRKTELSEIPHDFAFSEYRAFERWIF